MKGTINKPFDNIYELIKSHEITNPVLGNQLMQSIFGRLFLNVDNFQAIIGTDNKIRLFPNKQMIDLYRGQTKPYPHCFPSLFRQEQGSIQQLIDCIKTVEFELVLKDHPIVKELETKNLFIDYVGLAQHYGLKTNVLDLTSDIKIAAFFACCPYDPIFKKHNSNIEEGSIGVIYKTLQLALLNLDDPLKFEVIGLQPFHRPAQQKGYSYRLDIGEDFLSKCAKIYFKHSKIASEKLLIEFSKGNKLYPEDAIANIVQKINTGKIFTRESLRLALEKYNTLFTENLSKYEKKLKETGYKFTKSSIYYYTDKEKIKILKKWEEQDRDQFYSQIYTI